MKKKTVKVVENVVIRSLDGTESSDVQARIDTGAGVSSIDVKLAAQLKLGPISSYKKVRSANGETLRPIVEAKLVISGEEYSQKFTVANRSSMKYKVLIGRDLLEQGFTVDTTEDIVKEDER